MRKKQRQIIAMFTMLIMLLPLIFGCGSEVSDLPVGGSSRVESSEVPEKSTAEEAPTNELTTEESATEKPTEEALSTEEPVTEEPVTEEPVTEEPVTEEPVTEENVVEVEITLESARWEILTLYPGSGEGQVGYSTEGLAELEIGPEAFAVEDGIVYVLDSVNNRVIICKEGNYSYIDVSEYWRVRYMGFGNGRIGVAGYLNRQQNTQVIAVYSLDGIKEEQMAVNHVGLINHIIAIDDEGVVFGCTKGTRYTYNWKTKKQDVVRTRPGENDIWVGEQKAYIFGYGENVTYYRYRDGSCDFIGKEVSDVGRWYLVQELLNYRSRPLEALYVSTDGRLYLMECFEDRTVISELLLGGN